MSGTKCKVIACVCGAAQMIEKGNTVLAYRQSEGEPVDFHQQLLNSIEAENVSIYRILYNATGLQLLPQTVTRESMPTIMRQGYQAIITNEDRFTEAQLEQVVTHGNTAESLGQQWNDALLKDAGYPPIP
jgi:hypothetical protein